MSARMVWIAAEAERPPLSSQLEKILGAEADGKKLPGPTADELAAAGMPTHSFGGGAGPAVGTLGSEPDEAIAKDVVIRQPLRREICDEEYERRTYRGRTVALLRRYMRYSMETGRLPSLLGSEFFRTRVTSYTVVTFEDRIIFVHDMERCLERLDDFSRQLIARHILQEHDQLATSKLLHCSERTVRRHVPLVLDLLSEILLEMGLMERLDSSSEKSCQGDL
jgi:hypothetical protein